MLLRVRGKLVPCVGAQKLKMMESMTIRQAEERDAHAISDLIYEVSEAFLFQRFSDEGRQNFVRSIEPTAIADYINGEFYYYLAEAESELMGLIAMRDFRHLYHLFVRAAFQGRGIARKLWDYARETCIYAGNPGDFTVNSSAYALPVYLKWGFVEAGAAFDKGGIVSTPLRLRV
jgi:GNAT superfamily N-acetyltransferase